MTILRRSQKRSYFQSTETPSRKSFMSGPSRKNFMPVPSRNNMTGSTKKLKPSFSSPHSSLASLNRTRSARSSVEKNKHFYDKPSVLINPFSYQTTSKLVPALLPKSEIISSFAGAYIRNWIRLQQTLQQSQQTLQQSQQTLQQSQQTLQQSQQTLQQTKKTTYKYNFYELSYPNDKEIIKDVNGNNAKKIDLSGFTIIKVKYPAPPDHYPNHWYFKTPDSPPDTEDIISKDGWVKKQTLQYTNSYTLDWQLVSTNQFCMIYAFYGMIVPIKEQQLLKVENHKYVDEKIMSQIFDADKKRQSMYKGINFTNQDKNPTSIILTFLLNFILTEDKSLLKQSIKQGSQAYFQNHNENYELQDLLNQIQDGIYHPQRHSPRW